MNGANVTKKIKHSETRPTQIYEARERTWDRKKESLYEADGIWIQWFGSRFSFSKQPKIVSNSRFNVIFMELLCKSKLKANLSAARFCREKKKKNNRFVHILKTNDFINKKINRMTFISSQMPIYLCILLSVFHSFHSILFDKMECFPFYPDRSLK